MPGTVFEDESGQQFTNAYMYESEYKAAASAVTLCQVPRELTSAMPVASQLMVVDEGTAYPIGHSFMKIFYAVVRFVKGG